MLDFKYSQILILIETLTFKMKKRCSQERRLPFCLLQDMENPRFQFSIVFSPGERGTIY